jgi:V8-like Glu-specific endopeptidase
MKHALKSLSATSAILFLAAAPAANAGTETATGAPASITNPANITADNGYWTPERFKAAKPLPLPLPQAKPGAPNGTDSTTTEPGEEATGGDGQPPSANIVGAGQQLFTPDSALQASVIEPRANGSFGAPFTSTRVFPLFSGGLAAYSADHAYPYTAVGKLFFSINGAPYVCSASVINRRVVLTAGHCVHSGNGLSTGWYSNWNFVPAYRNGAAPFGSWTHWTLATTPPTWLSGGGGVPNAADYAMLTFADQAPPTGGTPAKLGNLTGWLGWQTVSLNGNHTTKLGYPCNLDSCGIMQSVSSQSSRATSPNNVEYGSDAGGGSSGGPWIQNFQTLAAGGGTGSNTGANRVVGVTSYGYTSADPKVQGAAIFDNRFVQLLNTACAAAGNCN